MIRRRRGEQADGDPAGNGRAAGRSGPGSRGEGARTGGPRSNGLRGGSPRGGGPRSGGQRPKTGTKRPLASPKQPRDSRRDVVRAAESFRSRSGGPVIEIRDVRKTYRIGDIAVHALRGVSLNIQRGEYVAIMGPSGSGKSTLMHILGCLDSPTSGTYRLNGIDTRGLDEDDLSDVRNRSIGFVFQAFNLIPRTRAVNNVELPLVYAGLTKAERRQRALGALASVGLTDRADHLPSELSGGQQQRVAVARALVTNPAMILADEPTGNLDSHSTAEILGVFARLNAQGRTIILITHEEEVAAHARRMIRVRDGRIVSDELIEKTEVTA